MHFVQVSWDGEPAAQSESRPPSPNRAKSRQDRRHEGDFGDLSQQGTTNPPHCECSLNGRGGLFIAVQKKELHGAVSGLLDGDTEPLKAK